MEVKIKLSSKRLNSGRCQVRFQVSHKSDSSSWYGYTIAEPQDTLKEVVNRIESRFVQAEDKLSLHQKVLYRLNKRMNQTDGLMIFKNA